MIGCSIIVSVEREGTPSIFSADVSVEIYGATSGRLTGAVQKQLFHDTLNRLTEDEKILSQSSFEYSESTLSLTWHLQGPRNP